jgi:hypothetical protein
VEPLLGTRSGESGMRDGAGRAFGRSTVSRGLSSSAASWLRTTRDRKESGEEMRNAPGSSPSSIACFEISVR